MHGQESFVREHDLQWRGYDQTDAARRSRARLYPLAKGVAVAALIPWRFRIDRAQRILFANTQRRADGFPGFKALGFVYFFPGIKSGTNDAPLGDPFGGFSCLTLDVDVVKLDDGQRHRPRNGPIEDFPAPCR